MAHFHFCEQCDAQYRCTAPFEDRPNYPGWLQCVTRKEADRRYRLCVDCAEKEPSTYEMDRYQALRIADEQRGDHVDANSSLGKDIAKHVRTVNPRKGRQ